MKCFRDGNQFVVTREDFVNLQESPAVFVPVDSADGRILEKAGVYGLSLGSLRPILEELWREAKPVLPAPPQLAECQAALAAYAQALEGVHICEDCGGSGIVGHFTGRPVVCQLCGGHEDSRGKGVIVPEVPDHIGRDRLALEREAADIVKRAANIPLEQLAAVGIVDLMETVHRLEEAGLL